MLQYPWHKLNREKVVAHWWTKQPIGLTLSQDAFSFWFGSRIRLSIRLTNYLECQPESSFFRLHCAFANVSNVLLRQMCDDDRVPVYEGDRSVSGVGDLSR